VKSLRNDMNRRICPSCGALPWTKCQTADGRSARMHVRRWSCLRAPHALRLTRAGEPCHPLYLPAVLKPVPYDGAPRA
jgi:hypothetical protein